MRLLVAGGELPVVASRMGPSGPVSAAGRIRVAEQVALSRLPRREEGGSGEVSVVAAPLVHYGRLLGVVEAVSAVGGRFDKVDLAVLTSVAEPRQSRSVMLARTRKWRSAPTEERKSSPTGGGLR